MTCLCNPHAESGEVERAPNCPIHRSHLPGYGAEDKAAVRALREHLVKERDWNFKWIQIHEFEGHPLAADRRREIVAEREAWITALDRLLFEGGER